uniref:poly(A) polymerase alpha-like isoform X2 n=1 Tax=Scatophagus argus TaxID=75038 RepID=UPI001ED7F002|nr:poly(A) polymerase alpha-like isoform X2 [Scatophagus argus]
MSTTWLIGLIFNLQWSRNKNIDLTFDLQSFSDTIYGLAERCKVFEEGMIISAMYVRRDYLSWALPNDEWKRLFTPKLKPTVSHQSSASPFHTAAVSAGRAATKTKGCFESDMSAKRLRDDKASTPSRQGTPSWLPQTETETQSPPPSVDSQSTKRPSSTEPGPPNKTFKLDPSASTVELSDSPPRPTKPVTGMKRAIKIQLLRYNTELRTETPEFPLTAHTSSLSYLVMCSKGHTSSSIHAEIQID